MDFHKIQSSDFQSVIDLLDASFPVSRAFIERDLKEIQKHPKANGDIYGLWADGELVGTAIYGAIYDSDDGWEGEGSIRYLAVHPEHRRKGHATWIIKRAIADLRQLNCPCIGVSVWQRIRWQSKYGKILVSHTTTHTNKTNTARIMLMGCGLKVKGNGISCCF